MVTFLVSSIQGKKYCQLRYECCSLNFFCCIQFVHSGPIFSVFRELSIAEHFDAKYGEDWHRFKGHSSAGTCGLTQSRYNEISDDMHSLRKVMTLNDKQSFKAIWQNTKRWSKYYRGSNKYGAKLIKKKSWYTDVE